ncbi:MAG: glutaredoxin [Opitutia bacterium]|nr:MAG: glutaredoxin [Opitutae bacterium]
MNIRCYLKPSCGWSNGVRAIMAKYALTYQDVDIINRPENYAEMVDKSGQSLSPCVEIDGVMLPDISGAEVEQYLLANQLVVPNDKAPAVPINAPCTDAEHEKMRVKTIRFF